MRTVLFSLTVLFLVVSGVGAGNTSLPPCSPTPLPTMDGPAGHLTYLPVVAHLPEVEAGVFPGEGTPTPPE